jgi:hypothetical protein
MLLKSKMNVPTDGSNFSWVFVGETLIVFTAPGVLKDERLDLLLREVKEHPVKYGIGASIGKGEMTSLQRKKSADVFSGVRLVGILDDRLTRGIMTALGWLGMNIKGFEWEYARDAIVHLGIPNVDPDELLSVIYELRDSGMAAVGQPRKKP